MRILTVLALAGALAAPLAAPLATALGASAATADTRIFIIENSDGYGIDGCLASGAPCGERVATAWCRSHAYSRALDFGRVENEPLLHASSVSRPACSGEECQKVVAITCSR